VNPAAHFASKHDYQKLLAKAGSPAPEGEHTLLPTLLSISPVHAQTASKGSESGIGASIAKAEFALFGDMRRIGVFLPNTQSFSAKQWIRVGVLILKRGFRMGLNKFIDKLKSALGSAQSKAGPMVDQARVKAAPVMDQAKATAADAKDKLSDAMSDAKTRMGDAQTQADDTVKQGNDAAASAKSQADAAASSAKAQADSARDAAQAQADEAKSRASAAADDAKAAIDDITPGR
jgi:hypothetical protein